MSKYLIFISIVLIGIIGIMGIIISNIKEDLSISISNNKASLLKNESLENNIRTYQFTVSELRYYADSINNEMLKVIEELKIKDKNLKSIQFIKSEITKVDSIIIRDTIFQTNVNIDTTLTDPWYNLNLKLQYPGTVVIDPTFTSDKYIVTSFRKETIKPPKKCAIARWFQKKHKVLMVDIKEKNPYIKNKQVRFIEIIK